MNEFWKGVIVFGQLAKHAEGWEWKEAEAEGEKKETSMSITDRMNRIRIELRQITRDMRGINPKLSLYKTLEARHAMLTKELEQLGAQRTARD